MNKIGAKAIATSIKEPKEPASFGNKAPKKLFKMACQNSGVSALTVTSTGAWTTYGSNPAGEAKIKIIMVMIGPIEAKPTRPNELSFDFLPPLVIATPAPKAKMNGTVPEPVVTPPASKMNGRYAWFFGST